MHVYETGIHCLMPIDIDKRLVTLVNRSGFVSAVAE